MEIKGLPLEGNASNFMETLLFQGYVKSDQAGGWYQAPVFHLWKLGRLNMAPCQERLNTGCTAEVQPLSSEMKERPRGEKWG